MGAFVIQGGPELELGAPVDKRHVSKHTMRCQYEPRYSEIRGSAGGGCERGMSCGVLEVSHGRCGKGFAGTHGLNMDNMHTQPSGAEREEEEVHTAHRVKQTVGE